MKVFIFARFHAREGCAHEIAHALRDIVPPTRQEAGCLGIDAFRSIHDTRLFYVHSAWVDEAAFEVHAALPHTLRFLERVEPLMDHALDVTRTESFL